MQIKILKHPDTFLRQPTEEIEFPLSEENNIILNNMIKIMYQANGIGLAANQVGYNRRMFVMDVSNERDNPQVFINPEIISYSGLKESFNEGCLSIPDIREDIVRENEILIEYLDENFTKKNLRLNGLRARVVQHEYDHIDGILFPERLSPLKRRMLKNRLNNVASGKIETAYKMKFNSK